MAHEVDGTGFTIEFVLARLKEASQKVDLRDLKDYRFKKFDSGQAFMSEILQVEFQWRRPNPLESVILKVPGFQNPAGEQDIDTVIGFLEKAHTRECDFYELFANPVIPVKLPKFFYGHAYSRHNRDGLIIMEDLSKRARTVGMLPGFTNEQTESLMVELGRIHAASLLDRSWLETIGVELHSMEEFINGTKELAQPLKKFKPEWFDKLLDEMDDAYTLEHYHNCTYTDTKFGIPACIVHADLWAANVLWEKDENGDTTSELASIIDWQMCYAGNPGADLARALGMNTPAKYRHTNETRLLRLYYESVEEAMNGQIPYTFEQLWSAYKASFPYVATVAGFGAPLYYKMPSIVGEPADPTLQNELLERVYEFFKDTVEILRQDRRDYV